MHRTEVTEITEGGLGLVRETFAGDIVGLHAKIPKWESIDDFTISRPEAVFTKTIFNAPPNFSLCDLVRCFSLSA
jgi:hypothetical protein